MRGKMETKKVSLLNAEYTCVTSDQLLSQVMDVLEHPAKDKKSTMIFLNVDVVMKIEKDPYLEKIVQEADYVLADGMPLIWFSKLFGKPLPEKISGSDFVPRLCAQAARAGKSVFLLGGAEGVAERAADKLRQLYPGIPVAGTYSPPFGFEKKEEELKRTIEKIKEAAPDILIACLGCPKQEKFIYENRERYGAALSVCAGATIDFLAGNVKRCPKWMSSCGLEWFYRFLKEPGRLFRRYFIDDVQILGLLWKYRKKG